MTPAAKLPREAWSLLLLCLLAFAPFGVMSPPIAHAVISPSYSSLTYSGVIQVTWTGITADWDGTLDLSTKLTFTVTLNQQVEDGNLTGYATAQGSISGTYSNPDDPDYPAGCPTQVSITGTYTYAIGGLTELADGQVTFVGSGPGNWSEQDNPPPGSECWPGVSAGGTPETYSEWTIYNDISNCFEQGDPCSQFPLDGGTTTVCSTTGPLGNCDGSEELTLTSSETTSQTPTISTTNETTCPTMTLTEGLAPAAPTTGETNIYLNLFWGGQIPASGLHVIFLSGLGPAGTNFLFNPVTMFGPTLSVLMDVTTNHTPDGVYTVHVSATVTNPPTNIPCTASADVTFTVSGTTVFTTTAGDFTGSALWPTGLTSPILITGNVSASQFSGVQATLDKNSHIVTIDFTLTGQAGTVGATTIAIPKTDLPPGTRPVLMEGGVRVQNQVLTEDANDYYIAFTTQFSTHNFVLQVEQATQSTSTSASSSVTTTSTTASSSGVTTSTSAVSSGITTYGSTTSATTTSPSGGIPTIGIAAASVVVFAALVAIVLLRLRRGTNMAEVGRAPASNTGEMYRAKYCGKCGQANVTGEDFCTNCGANLLRRSTQKDN